VIGGFSVLSRSKFRLCMTIVVLCVGESLLHHSVTPTLWWLMGVVGLAGWGLMLGSSRRSCSSRPSSFPVLTYRGVFERECMRVVECGDILFYSF